MIFERQVQIVSTECSLFLTWDIPFNGIDQIPLCKSRTCIVIVDMKTVKRDDLCFTMHSVKEHVSQYNLKTRFAYLNTCKCT